MADSILALAFPSMSILEQTPKTLRSILANATQEDLDWQPSPDRWSVSMVLAHLADVEVKGFMSRFIAMVDRDNPRLPAYDQPALFRTAKRFDGLAELREFGRRRGETLAWLRPQPASVGTRIGLHEEIGSISFDELLYEFVFHDLGHIRQVIELYRSHAFYPKMGGFRSYYKINP